MRFGNEIPNGIRQRVREIDEVPNVLNTVCPVPKAVKIELCSGCNLACSFCCNKDYAKPSMINWNDFTRIIKELNSIGVKETGLLYLGEPTLHPKLIDCINFAKQYMDYVFITTNGVLVEDKLMEDICNSKLDSLKWSINQCNAKDFLQQTGRDYFDRVVKNIKTTWKYVKENNLPLKLYASTTLYNVDNISEEMKTFIDNEVKPYVLEHYYFPINNQGGLLKNEIFNLDCCNRQPLCPCPRLFNNSYITTDLDVMCCCGGFTKDFCVGSMKTNTFLECWNGEKMQELRRKHINGNIANCVCTNKKQYKGR